MGKLTVAKVKSITEPGRYLSDMTLTKLLLSTGLAERATVHGIRSSFRE